MSRLGERDYCSFIFYYIITAYIFITAYPALELGSMRLCEKALSTWLSVSNRDEDDGDYGTHQKQPPQSREEESMHTAYRGNKL